RRVQRAVLDHRSGSRWPRGNARRSGRRHPDVRLSGDTDRRPVPGAHALQRSELRGPLHELRVRREQAHLQSLADDGVLLDDPANVPHSAESNYNPISEINDGSFYREWLGKVSGVYIFPKDVSVAV